MANPNSTQKHAVAQPRPVHGIRTRFLSREA